MPNSIHSASAGSLLARLGRPALLAGGALYLLVYIVLALWRMSYPYELEWIEGGTLEHVRRVLAGLPLYVAPSMEFVPLLYPPLYYYLAAGATTILGEGFLALRLVSFLASLGCFVLLFAVVRRETSSTYAGAVAAALFAAAFRQGGAWLDLARVDSVFLLFVFGTIYLVRAGTSARAAAAAGLLITLAYLTKQSALPITVPLVLYAAVTKPRYALWLAGTMAVTLGGSAWLLDHLSEGWYQYYTWVMPRHHHLVEHRFLGFWTGDLLRPFPIALVTALGYLTLLARARHWDRLLFYGLTAGGLVGTAYVSRLHSGGYDNVLLSAYAAGAVLFSLGLHALLERVRQHGPAGRGWLEAGVYAVAAVQFLLLLYNPARQLPNRADREAGRALVAAIAEVDGEVWIPGAGYLAVLAGKPALAHGAMVTDVIRAGVEPAKGLMVEALARAIRERRFAALIMDQGFPPDCPPRGLVVTDINWFCQDLHEHYVKVRSLVDGAAFWPRTGVPGKPEGLYAPRSDPGDPSAPADAVSTPAASATM